MAQQSLQQCWWFHCRAIRGKPARVNCLFSHRQILSLVFPCVSAVLKYWWVLCGHGVQPYAKRLFWLFQFLGLPPKPIPVILAFVVLRLLKRRFDHCEMMCRLLQTKINSEHRNEGFRLYPGLIFSLWRIALQRPLQLLRMQQALGRGLALQHYRQRWGCPQFRAAEAKPINLG